MVDYAVYYPITRNIPEQFKMIAKYWGIEDPLIGPLFVMGIVIAFYYLILLISIKPVFRILRVEERLLRFLALIIAIFLTFGLSGLAIIFFSNPFVALALMIIAIILYSRLGRRAIF